MIHGLILSMVLIPLTATAADFTVHHGRASSFPLSLAAKNLVPKDIKLHLQLKQNANKLVTYEGGKPWPLLLLNITKTLPIIVEFGPDTVILRDISDKPKEHKDHIENLFKVTRGSTLYDQLHHWAKREDWTIEWNGNWDYPILSDAEFSSDFVLASQKLLEAFAQAEPPLSAKIYPQSKIIKVDINANR